MTIGYGPFSGVDPRDGLRRSGKVTPVPKIASIDERVFVRQLRRRRRPLLPKTSTTPNRREPIELRSSEASPARGSA